MNLNRAYKYINEQNLLINLSENCEKIMTDEELKKAEAILESEVNISYDVEDIYDEILRESDYNPLETEIRIFCKCHVSEYGYKIPVAYDYAFLNSSEEVKLSEEDIIYIDCNLKQAIEIFKLENEII